MIHRSLFRWALCVPAIGLVSSLAFLACDISVDDGSEDDDDADDGGGGGTGNSDDTGTSTKGSISGGGGTTTAGGTSGEVSTDDGRVDDGVLDTGEEGFGSSGEGEGESGLGGGVAEAACEAYCEVEVACNDFYATEEECFADCLNIQAQAEDVGCGEPQIVLNACLATLDCEGVAAYLIAIDEINATGQASAPFPCEEETFDFAACVFGA